jgi:hypothetical protein
MTPTREQIQSLKEEAQAAGDQDMVTICDFAVLDLESSKWGWAAVGSTAWVELMEEIQRIGLDLPDDEIDLESAIQQAAGERVAEVLVAALAQADTL